MGMNWEDRSDTRWIVLTGDLDHVGCSNVHQELKQVATSSSSSVVVDLEAVPFIASNGLRMLLEIHHDLRSAGHTLQVRNLQPSVRSVFQTTGIFDAIPEFEG